MSTRISLLAILVAAAVTAWLLYETTTRLGPWGKAGGQLLFLLGPYATLGILAWVGRSRRAMRRVLLGLTFLVSGFGVYGCLAVYDRFLQRDPATPGGSDWFLFGVAAVQWAVTIAVIAVVALLGLYRKYRAR